MTTLDRFTYSSAQWKRIKAVQFSVWNPDEIVSEGALLLLSLPEGCGNNARSLASWRL